MTEQLADAGGKESSGEERDRSAELLRALRGLRPRPTIEALIQENEQLRQTVEAITVTQEDLRAKLEALAAPEHYPVAITNVCHNGSPRIEVAGHGGARAQVAVHPDIEPGALIVGRRAVLAKGRNCLLHVDEGPPDWQDVAAFEDYLPGRSRVLLRYQDQLQAATLAAAMADVPLQRGDLVGFDRQAGMAYARLDPPAMDSLFSSDVPSDEFSELGGLEWPIAQVKRAIDFAVRFPAIAARHRVRSKRGILLYGPPGNGKTRIGRCAATYLSRVLPGTGCRFMSLVGASDIYTPWLGESEARLKALFAAAEKASREGPVVLFFDELDALGRCRGTDHGSSAPDRILGTFVGLLDGIKRLSGLVVMGATNRESSLDPALVRPGRFDLKIRIPAPQRKAARTVLQLYLRDLPRAAEQASWDPLVESLLARIFSPNGEYASVATVKLNDGRNLAVPARELVSGAMLENVVSVASEEVAAREVQTGKPETLTAEDLLDALHGELSATAALLTPANLKAYVATIPQDALAVAVTPAIHSTNGTRYTR